MTAELSDAFMSKKEGVNVILESIEKCYPNEKIRIISNKNKFLSLRQAYGNYKAISASNWVATALFLGNFTENAILIDAGSTTVDIIPIKDKIPITKGKDDISRLIHHELVYTGGLRATIPSITHFVPYKNNMIRISFEKFALISDVHRILGNISEEKYINETADKRSTDLNHCYARLARMLCLDLEMISKSELDRICHFIYEKQLEIVKSEIQQFMNGIKNRETSLTENPLFIITGLSSNFLVKKALEELNYNNIQNFEDVTHISDNISSSAFAVAGALYYSLG
jgi:probable H4MPT-linked C1 transfer pathway protein